MQRIYTDYYWPTVWANIPSVTVYPENAPFYLTLIFAGYGLV
jgi:hypothetical protein